MANTAAAKKEMRASARKAVRNRSVKSAVKTRIVRVRRAIQEGGGAEAAAELTTVAIASLDRAAAKGILHANNAARRKSRLMKRLNEAAAGVVHQEPAKGVRKGATAKASAKATKATKGAPAAKKPARVTKKKS